MNPTTEQQLDAIAAQCKANLTLADKWTPGKWYITCMGRCSSYDFSVPEVCQLLPELVHWTDQQRANGDYIAACAGAAESGWRSTIAAIEGLQKIAWVEASGNRDYSWTGEQAFAALTAIVSAWEANK